MINETKWHPEEGLYVGVTGQSCLFPRASDGVPVVATIPTKGTIPLAKTMTGTLRTDGAASASITSVRGTGTLFTTEFKPGDYLYNNDASVRKILEIISDTLMIIESPFPSALTSPTAALKCEPQTFKMVQFNSTGIAAAIVQEAPYAVGMKFIGGGSPVAYDASASNAGLTISVHK